MKAVFVVLFITIAGASITNAQHSIIDQETSLQDSILEGDASAAIAWEYTKRLPKDIGIPIPNAHTKDNSVNIPNGYKGDDSVPIPNASKEIVPLVPDSSKGNHHSMPNAYQRKKSGNGTTIPNDYKRDDSIPISNARRYRFRDHQSLSGDSLSFRHFNRPSD